MKKYTIFALTLVLTAALFTGCGCTNQDMDMTTVPAALPTTYATTETTHATVPTTHATTPTTRATTESTTEPLESGITETTTAANRSADRNGSTR